MTNDHDNQPEYRGSDDIRTGFIFGNTFAAKKVTYSVIDGRAIFEGDILVDPAEETDPRSRHTGRRPAHSGDRNHRHSVSAGPAG